MKILQRKSVNYSMQINGYQVLISGQYNAFNEGWNGAGVYACSGNYVSDTFKIPAYFGSTKDLRHRIEDQHINSLEKGKHQHNRPLQNAWNHHSKNEGFVWFLIESCPPTKQILLEREQYYLDLYRPFVDEFGGFNICHEVTGGMSGRKHSIETKEKMSKIHKGSKMPAEYLARRINTSKANGYVVSEETKEKMRQNNIGKKHSEETKIKMSKSHIGKHFKTEEAKKELAKNAAKTWHFYNPEGIEVEIFNLKEFCQNNNLSYACMDQVKRGNNRSHKGWTFNSAKTIDKSTNS